MPNLRDEYCRLTRGHEWFINTTHPVFPQEAHDGKERESHPCILRRA